MPNLREKVLCISGSDVVSKADAFEVLAEHLYDLNKRTFSKVSYVKFPIIVPKHVIGFIIGNDGRTIKGIRTQTGARIDVKEQEIDDKLLRIDVAGSVSETVGAIERIYKIVSKFYYFEPEKPKEVEQSRKTEKQAPVQESAKTVPEEPLKPVIEQENKTETEIQFLFPSGEVEQANKLLTELEMMHSVKIKLRVGF